MNNSHPWLKLIAYMAFCIGLSAIGWALFGPGFTAWVDEVLKGLDWMHDLLF